MHKLKILYLDTEAVWRGGQQQLLSLLRGLQSRGHQIELASPQRAPLAARAADSGIRTHAFRLRSEGNPAAAWRLSRLLRKNGPFQVIHSNTPRSMIVAWLAASSVGVPVRVASRRVSFPLRSPLSRLKYNWMVDRTLAVSESCLHQMTCCGVSGRRVQVIYEGVDLCAFDRIAPSRVLGGIAGPRIGVVAGLTEEKGHRFFLQAATMAARRHPGAHFVVVGEGPLGNRLQEQAKSLLRAGRITFTGFVREVDALVKELDIVCLPSLSEGLSSAILSAMAASLPVVATRVGGNPELVLDRRTGLLVEPADGDALERAIGRLIDSESLRRRLGEAARKRVASHFTVERKIQETEQAYLELLQLRRVR